MMLLVEDSVNISAIIPIVTGDFMLVMTDALGVQNDGETFVLQEVDLAKEARSK